MPGKALPLPTCLSATTQNSLTSTRTLRSWSPPNLKAIRLWTGCAPPRWLRWTSTRNWCWLARPFTVAKLKNQYLRSSIMSFRNRMFFLCTVPPISAKKAMLPCFLVLAAQVKLPYPLMSRAHWSGTMSTAGVKTGSSTLKAVATRKLSDWIQNTNPWFGPRSIALALCSKTYR